MFIVSSKSNGGQGPGDRKASGRGSPGSKPNRDNQLSSSASNLNNKPDGVTDDRQAIGIEDDFERLYNEYRARVFSTAYRFMHCRQDAEDITQDVFVKVYRKRSDFRGEAALSTWIYRITVNTALDLLRKRKRRPTVPIEDVSEPAAGPSNLTSLIESMIPQLPEGYRKVFVLHDIEGLKHSEIGEILGISEGASKSQLHRARAVLRQMLTPFVKGRFGAY